MSFCILLVVKLQRKKGKRTQCCWFFVRPPFPLIWVICVVPLIATLALMLMHLHLATQSPSMWLLGAGGMTTAWKLMFCDVFALRTSAQLMDTQFCCKWLAGAHSRRISLDQMLGPVGFFGALGASMASSLHPPVLQPPMMFRRLNLSCRLGPSLAHT